MSRGRVKKGGRERKSVRERERERRERETNNSTAYLKKTRPIEEFEDTAVSHHNESRLAQISLCTAAGV